MVGWSDILCIIDTVPLAGDEGTFQLNENHIDMFGTKQCPCCGKEILSVAKNVNIAANGLTMKGEGRGEEDEKVVNIRWNILTGATRWK